MPKSDARRLTFGSTFSSIGALDLGLERAGIGIAFQCELDAYRRSVLKRHWPHLPLCDDVRRLTSRRTIHGQPATRDQTNGDGPRGNPAWWVYPGAVPLDGICGGSPCQDLSVAGRRKGLAGERSGLFFQFARVADEFVRPGGWVVFENVPGLLSSHGGRDFAIVVRTLGDIGFHDLAWRMLDSRYFGVPQRRRRVFVVARRAVGSGAREVLLEPESGGGDFAPRSQAGAHAAAGTRARADAFGLELAGAVLGGDQGDHGRSHRLGADEAAGGQIVAALDRRRGGVDDNEAQAGHIVGYFDEAGPVGGGNFHGSGRRSEDDPNLVPACRTITSHQRYDGDTETFVTAADANGAGAPPGPAGPMDPQPDGPRDAAIGDAVTVPVAQWIGSRLMEWERAHG